MPWTVKKVGSAFNVVKKGTGEKVASHPDRGAAQRHVRAMYASYHGKKRKTKSGGNAGIMNAAQRRLQTKRKMLKKKTVKAEQ